jgi:hypothetical protein
LSAKPLFGFIRFALAWSFLNALVNSRWPDEAPALRDMLPALDVTLLSAVYVLLGRVGIRVPNLLQRLLAGTLVFVHLLRAAQGLEQRYLARHLNLYFDLPLVPELIRLLHSTLPLTRFVFGIGAFLLGMFVLAYVTYKCLNVVRDYLAGFFHAAMFAVAAFAWLAVRPCKRLEPSTGFWRGAFTVSAVPDLKAQIALFSEARVRRALQSTLIAQAQSALNEQPHDLSKLGRQNVYLFLVESYGEVVFARDTYKTESAELYTRVEHSLEEHGFSCASSFLESPTYGGSSWLAHATLASGVQTSDQLEYELLLAAKPKTIARFFNDAGYRSVLVQPGTTRPWPQGNVYGFDRKYYAWNFDYQGPRFNWAPMPDQYVLEFIRKRELSRAQPPLFLEHALVSSHAPWNEQPPLIPNWAEVGNGSIYLHRRAIRFPVTWPDLSNAAPAYMRSITYDFEILHRYIIDFVGGDALLVIVGDHQPAAEVAQSSSHRVPIHVISRRRSFIDAFVNRGYTRGMRPTRSVPALAMHRFLPEFLRMFSTGSAG